MTDDQPVRHPAQQAFFACYPLSATADLHALAERIDVAPQTVYGWIGGHSRIHRETFLNVVVPFLRKRYPDIDPDLIDEVAQQANPHRLRRVTRPEAVPDRQETAPAPAAPESNVGDVLTALATFQPLSVMLRSARLSAEQRMALIHILSEGGRNQ